MQPTSTTPSIDLSADASVRRQGARRVAFEVLERREKGEALTDEAIVESHPGLMPELIEELATIRGIRRARLAATDAAGTLRPIEVLDDEQLDEPIELEEPASDTGDFAATPPIPVVPGYGTVEEIGRGSQGAVYRAIQESTGRTVAIKVMGDGLLATSRHRVRFDREAKILASIRHPHVVTILDRGRTRDGCLCFVMEYVEGCDLDAYCSLRLPAGTEGTRQLLSLFAKVCRGVAAAHAQGVVHRDLKPTNVRVDDQGEPHVLDFGLAREPEGRAVTLTRSGQIVGSVPWASPEQAAGDTDELSTASDVYSLGVMLYQSLTGRHPYVSTGPMRLVLDNIATAVPQPPSRVLGALSINRSLDAVVLRALAKRPQDRYPSAAELANDLDKVVRGQAIQPLRRRWTRRSVVAMWTTALVGAAACGLVSSSFSKPDPQVIQLPTMINSLGMKLVRLPAVDGLIGTTTSNGSAVVEMRPAKMFDNHLYVAVTEVTQKQYEAVMGTNPSDSRFRGPDLPVNQVTWYEATQFCSKLSKREHRHYRLPTEAEWVYACQAVRPVGHYTPVPLEPFAWMASNSNGTLHPVAQKAPNIWGLYDMHGNAEEWCADAFQPAEHLPLDSDPHTVKGGSAFSHVAECGAVAHHGVEPQSRRSDLGFRVVCDPN
jgi:serine/threonine protein kinase